MTPILEILNLTKRFGEFNANEDISLSVNQGEIHALVGENGAGKSTLMKCLFGLLRPDSGHIRLHGEEIRIQSPRAATAYGIGMVHQHFMLIPSFPVYKNVVLGEEPTRGIQFMEQEAIARLKMLSERYHLDLDPLAETRSLPVGLQQRVEILKLLHREADILIFDEPTAVLSPQEVDSFFDILKGFRDQNKTILFIAHKLREVLAIADRITVLRKGRVVKTINRSETNEQDLTHMMLGKEIAALSLTAVNKGAPILKVTDLSAIDDRGIPLLQGISFHVLSGEVLGVAGVMGNGQSELAEVIAGMRPQQQGTIELNDAFIEQKNVLQRRQGGMAHIPEDRLGTGLAPLATLWENILMGHQNAPSYSKNGFLLHSGIQQFAHHVIKKYDVRVADDQGQAGTLSGGNMQKMIFGREMEQGANFLLVSQPTRGVDINGINYIHEKLLQHRASGGGVLLISSDLDEILKLSDRIAVLYQGRMVAILPREEATREIIGKYMLQGSEENDSLN